MTELAEETQEEENELFAIYQQINDHAKEGGLSDALVLAIYTKIASRRGDINGMLEELMSSVDFVISNPDKAVAYMWEQYGMEYDPATKESVQNEVDEDGCVVDVHKALAERVQDRAALLAYLRDFGLLPPVMERKGRFEGVVDQSSFDWFIGLIADLRNKQAKHQKQCDAMKADIDQDIRRLKWHFGKGAEAIAISQIPKKKDGSPRTKSLPTMHGTFFFEKTGGWKRDTTKAGNAEFEASLAKLTEEEMEALGITTEEIVTYKYESAKLLEAIKAGKAKLGGYVKKGEENEFGYWDIKVEKAKEPVEPA